MKNVLTLLVALALFVAVGTPAVAIDRGFRDDLLGVGHFNTQLGEPALQQSPVERPVTEEPTAPEFQQPTLNEPVRLEEPQAQSKNSESTEPAVQPILGEGNQSVAEPLGPETPQGLESWPLEAHPLDNQPLDAASVAPTIPTALGDPIVPKSEEVTDRLPQPEAASFAGITPGESMMDQVEESWDAPAEIVRQDGVIIHRYKIEPFERIEVVFAGEKVATIIVRLEGSLPADKLSQELKIDDITPVFVSGELGEILGQAFPERGVLFAFDQKAALTDGPANPVTEIVLEPLGPDPFVLRAESRLDSHFDENLRDLELAIKLDPNHARAHWLYSRVLCAVGRTDEAVTAIKKSIKFDDKNAQYRVTYAQILDQLGDPAEAIAQAKAAVERSKKRPHIKARALCLVGDLLNAAATPDMAEALKYHTEAIKTAEPILSNRHPAVRKIAKEVIIDAHLGAASDIAWGEWSSKGKAVDRWTALAAAFAEEFIANDGGTDEHRFRVASRALAAYVGTVGELDPTEWAEESLHVGEQLIKQSVDPTVRQQLEWETGMAAFNAVQVYQARKDQESSLKYGELAAKHLEAGRLESEPEQGYLLGRLHFRLGTIHALAQEDHEAAVVCYERASKLFEQPVPNQSSVEVGRQGEAYVSMGVSFWEVGRKEEAIEMTKQGVDLVKQAVTAGVMPESALVVPYENLANMQRYEGQTNAAALTQQLANTIKEAKDAPQTAAKPGSKTMR